MLFILLYIPCVSTMSAIKQEASRKYMWLGIFWSLFLAYMAATLFYQIASWFASLSQDDKLMYSAALSMLIAILIIIRLFKVWRTKRALPIT